MFLVEEFSCEVDIIEGPSDSMSRLLVSEGFHTLYAIVGHFLGEVLH